MEKKCSVHQMKSESIFQVLLESGIFLFCKMQKISQCKDFLCKTPFSTKTKISVIIPFSQQTLVTSAQCRTIIIISLYILAVNELVLKKTKNFCKIALRLRFFAQNKLHKTMLPHEVTAD